MSQGFIIGLRHRSKSFLQKVNADDWIEFIMIINKFKTLLKYFLISGFSITWKPALRPPL